VKNVFHKIEKVKKKIQTTEPLEPAGFYRLFYKVFSQFGCGPVLSANRTGLRSGSTGRSGAV
jgi:hypothetical protein